MEGLRIKGVKKVGLNCGTKKIITTFIPPVMEFAINCPIKADNSYFKRFVIHLK
jgi:hypothetical protein